MRLRVPKASPAESKASPAISAPVARGLWLGLLGVTIFAITTPMTRLAVGDASNPQLSPLFVTAGRAAVAGLLSALWLLATRAPRPRRDQLPTFTMAAAGVVIGFPLFLALALRAVPAAHAAVVTGLLPLATAAVGALLLRQRPGIGFWACAVLGCALVVGYAAWQGGGRLVVADGLLLLAVLSGAVGYVQGARLAGPGQGLRPEQVICWILVGSLPLTLPLALWSARSLDGATIGVAAWFGFAYVALFSMWLGFFAWYRALAIGGTLRVSQVQLLQPFLSVLAAVPLLGEAIDAPTVVFALAVVATVFLGKRMPVGAPP